MIIVELSKDFAERFRSDFKELFYMRRKLFLFFILAALPFQTVSAQRTPITEMRVVNSRAQLDKAELSAENKKRVSEILHENAAATALLQSPDNRINYTLKTATALWKIDEKEGRGLMAMAMNDIRQAVVETDNEMNRIENGAEISGLNAGGDLWQKTSRIMSLRHALVNQTSSLDPEFGLNFLRETMRIITNGELRKRIEQNDKYLESMLIGRIAENDPAKALELGRQKLAEGFDGEAVSLLQTIYGKDKEKGAAFAEDLLKQIKSGNFSSDMTWGLSSLFDSGVSNFEQIVREESKDKPMFSEQSLRDLAALLGKQITDPLGRSDYFDLSAELLASMQKYAPQFSSQIKKMAELQRQRGEREKVEPEKPSTFDDAISKQYETQSKYQSEIDTKVQGLSGENVSSEQKKKIIEEARSKILESADKNARFAGLVSLATQAANAGEKESAVAILEESERFINLQPKEMREFTEVWLLAKGYATVKPERSFALLEDTIFRLNAVIDAYVKFSEFQNGASTIENGEVKMGDYGGQMFGFFYSTGDVIAKLADADFARAKDLADKFERPEFRVETRLLIATSISQPQFNLKKVAPGVVLRRE